MSRLFLSLHIWVIWLSFYVYESSLFLSIYIDISRFSLSIYIWVFFLSFYIHESSLSLYTCMSRLSLSLSLSVVSISRSLYISRLFLSIYIHESSLALSMSRLFLSIHIWIVSRSLYTTHATESCHTCEWGNTPICAKCYTSSLPLPVPQTKEIGLKIITTAKISNKFSQESPYMSNTFSRESPTFQTGFHVNNRSPRHSKECTVKP